MSSLQEKLLNQLCAAREFGMGVLVSPQDVAVVPNQSTGNFLAVADDSNGLLIFARSLGALKHHVRSCADAGSVCFDPKSNRLIVSVSKTMSAGDSTPGELHFYTISHGGEAKFEQKLELPVEPKIRHGYIRWVCSDASSGNIFVVSGDNQNAAIWKHDVSTGNWTTLLQRDGDLEHPCILLQSDETSGHLSMLLVCFDADWCVIKLTFDSTDKLIHEETLIQGHKDLQAPWSIALNQESGCLAVYDYQSGNIYELMGPDYKKGLRLIAAVKAGQWMSMKYFADRLLVSCSDEGLVREFFTRKD